MKTVLTYIGNFNKSIKFCCLFFFAGISIYNFEIISTKMSLNEESLPLNFNNIWILDLSLINLDPTIIFAIISITILMLFVIAQFFSIYSIVIGFILFMGSIAFQILRNYYLKFDVLWKLPFSDQIKIYRIWTDEDKLNLWIENYNKFTIENQINLEISNNEIINLLKNCNRKEEILNNINYFLNQQLAEKSKTIVSNNSFKILDNIEGILSSTISWVYNHPVLTGLIICTLVCGVGYVIKEYTIQTKTQEYLQMQIDFLKKRVTNLEDSDKSTLEILEKFQKDTNELQSHITKLEKTQIEQIMEINPAISETVQSIDSNFANLANKNIKFEENFEQINNVLNKNTEMLTNHQDKINKFDLALPQISTIVRGILRKLHMINN